MPLSFADIDQALAEAAKTNISHKRGKKRQNATVTRLNPSLKTAGNEITAGDEPTSSTGESSDLRTGRWTQEEIAYCDKLIEHFSDGTLPIPEKLKLNDFLANMLKSKQSRLTKKMKNARFSAKLYERKSGFTLGLEEAREFSQLETDFFASMKCNMERSEIRFHMQKVWRELFSSFCVSVGQNMDLDAWLKSVEEVDRRANEAKDAARKARRHMMMGAALRSDSNNASNGVFINPNAASETQAQAVLDRNGDVVADASSETDSLSTNFLAKRLKVAAQSKEMAAAFHASPYVARVIQYVQTRGLPFEHLDIWVPSFITNPNDITKTGHDETCRLCFAGAATADTKVPPGGLQAVPMTPAEKFNMISFGVYSQKFSFVVGSGLPGRIYSSGVASWEQGIQSAPQSLFERVGGAQQWGVETVLGIPVASPTVGRVVVLLYSMHDRLRDADMVNRMSEEMTALLPSPRWKLVVEVGEGAPPEANQAPITGEDPRIPELVSLIENNMPEDQHSSLAPLLPGITALRLLLLKPTRTLEDNESLDVALNTYESYRLEGRSASDIIRLTSRTFMVMARQTASTGSLQANSDALSTASGSNPPSQHQRPSPRYNPSTGAPAGDKPFLEGLNAGARSNNEAFGRNNDQLLNGNPMPDNTGGDGQQALANNNQQIGAEMSMNHTLQLTGQLSLPNTNNNQMVGATYGSLAEGPSNGPTNLASNFQQQRQNEVNQGMSAATLQQLTAGNFNGILPDFGGLDAAVLSNLSASQLAALLQNESPNFL